MGHIGEKNFRYPVDFHLLCGFLGPQCSPDKVNEVKNPGGSFGANSKIPLGFNTLLSSSPAASTWLLMSGSQLALQKNECCDRLAMSAIGRLRRLGMITEMPPTSLHWRVWLRSRGHILVVEWEVRANPSLPRDSQQKLALWMSSDTSQAPPSRVPWSCGWWPRCSEYPTSDQPPGNNKRGFVRKVVGWVIF